MAELRIRDEYQNEFVIDASARPFWENRPGIVILDDQPAAPAEKAAPRPPSAAAAASTKPDVPGATGEPQRGSKKG